jgi:hypothetical protein
VSKQALSFSIGVALLVAGAATRTEAQSCVLPAWGSGAPLATDAFGPAVASAGGQIYAAGGFSFNAGAALSNFERFDPGLAAWTPLAPLPSPRVWATLAYDPSGNRLFLFGGSANGRTVSTLVQVYNIAGDSWSTGPPLPAARQQMAGGTIGSSIYLVGGDSTGQPTAESQSWLFDPRAGTYTPRAVLPTTLNGAGSAVAGGKLYVLGGENGAISELGSNFVYDAAADSWAARASLPTAVNAPGASALGGPDGCTGKILVAGGGNPFLQALTAGQLQEPILTTGITQMYDIASDTWAAGPALPTALSLLGAAQAGDTLLVVGGFNGTDSVATVDRIQGPPLPVGLSGFSIE